MDKAKFFQTVRTSLFAPTLSQDEVDGCNAVLDAMAGSPPAYTAYALATAYHETAHTMHPIGEMGGNAYFFRMYDKDGQRPNVARVLGNTQPGDGVTFHGRGYVQLTGRGLYDRAGRKLGVDLVGNPDLALRDDIAAKIMRDGMTEGWFTGKKLADYLPATGPGNRNAFMQARRIINGQDRAADIADYAMRFQGAML